ncbi:MAG TPA: hypothetical protein PLJ04_03590 [Candidatus Saccharibacteria bacterium]|nr:hypothetical protein [Candidatus Saccharibacteria bacterium]
MTTAPGEPGYPAYTGNHFHGSNTSTFDDGVEKENPTDIDNLTKHVPQQRDTTVVNTPEIAQPDIDHKKILEDYRQTAIGFATYELDKSKKTEFLRRAQAIEYYLAIQPEPTYGQFMSLTYEEIEEAYYQAQLHKAYEKSAKNIGRLGVAPLHR